MSKLIQLVPWRDLLLGLDDEGNIWTLRVDRNGFDPAVSGVTCELWWPSPGHHEMASHGSAGGGKNH